MARGLLLSMDYWGVSTGRIRSATNYGALDLMILKILAGIGPQHGYGIARSIEQIAQGSLALYQGTIYPELLRLEQKGWIASDDGRSGESGR